MNKSFFIYKNKEYPFDLSLFQQYSKYPIEKTKLIQESKEIYFSLISENENYQNLSDNTIQTFISHCQNQKIKITNSNIIPIRFLSHKYEVESLILKAEKYITNHKYEIVDEYLSDSIDENEFNFIIEDLFSNLITKYFEDDRLLNIPVSNLYRILDKFKYYNDLRDQNDDEFPIIKFIVKYIEKNGPETSFLLTLFKLGNKSCEYINEKMSENINLIDFDCIKQTIFRNFHKMNQKIKERETEIRREFLHRQKANIENIRLNCISLFNDLINIEPLRNFFPNDDENSDKKFSPALIQYGILYSIRSIFNNSFVPVDSIQKDISLILDKKKSDGSQQSKFTILSSLLNENLFSENSSILLGNKDYNEIISIVAMIQIKKTKESIIDLFKLIENKPLLIVFVLKIFPYYYLKDTELKLIVSWIPVISLLIESNICFSLTIDNNKFEFNESSSIDCKVELLMNNKNDFSLSHGSRIISSDKENHFPLDLDDENIVFQMLRDLSIKKMKTSVPMNNDEIFRYLYLQAKINYEKNGDENIYKNLLLSIKGLFDNNYRSTINLIWNLIFTLSEFEVLEISTIINPIESQILISSLKLFKTTGNQNIDEIINWSKWAENYDKHSQVLTEIFLCINTSYDNLCTNDISSLINKLEDATDFLEEVPEKTNEFWNELINKCKKEYKCLIDTKEKKKKIEEKFNELLDKIDKADIVDAKILEIEKEIIIINLSFVEVLNKKVCLNLQKIFEQLLSSSSKNNEKGEIESICWPEIESSESITETKNIQIFESLFFYSKVKSLIDEMKKTDNVISILTKLRCFPEMNFSIKFLISDLIHSDNEKLIISDENIKYVQYTMEANLIMKLYRINDMILSNPSCLRDFINNFEKRDSCNNEDIQWMNSAMKELSPDFMISLPKFDPNSLVFMVINKVSENNYVPGPLLFNINELKIALIENQSLLINCKFDSFIDAAKSIGQIFYNSFISSNKIPPQKYTDIKDVFNKSYELPEIKMEIINRLKILFSIAESLERWTKSSFSFNDTFFLSMDWYELCSNENLLNNFPSLLFWIYKNKQCAEQIRKTYHNFEPNNYKIPIWLVYLRLISSKQCITFDSFSETKMSELINKTTISCILKYFDENRYQKKSIKCDWIDVLFNNTPSNMKTRIFYDFLYNLSFDDLDNQSKDILEWKYFFIKESISQLISSILSNKLEIIQCNFFDISSISNFLCYPSKYIHNKIEQRLNNHKKETLFKYNYDLIDISKLNKNQAIKFSFSDQINKKILAQPTFYLSTENEIKCTINKLECQIGPLFSSLLSNDPILISLSSTIDEKINLSIDCPNYSNILFTKEIIKNKKPIKLFIKPPKITNKKKNIIKITGNLKIGIIGNKKEYLFPFDITLILLPIKAFIKCDQYSLSEIENNYFRLCCDQINSEEIINFEIQNYYLPDFTILNFELVPHEENNADEPIVYLTEKTRSLLLYMPSVKQPTRCKFDIILKLSQNLEAKIHCDFVIRPIVCFFEMFDYCKKAFSDDCKVVLIKQDYIQYLHFRILLPYPIKQKAKISIKLPSFVTVEGSSLKIIHQENNIEFIEFEVNDDFYFEIIISNSLPPNDLNGDYFIQLKIADFLKSIQLTFVNSSDDLFDPNYECVNDQYFNDFPCYSYLINDERWERIKSNEDFQKIKQNDIFYVITTPFAWYPNKDRFIIINYHQETNNYISVTNKTKLQIKYIQISGDQKSIRISQSSIDIEKTVEKKYFYFSKQKNTSYYSIVGFIEEDPEEWFPTLDKYPNISENDLLKYSDDEENSSKASLKIDEILKFYNKSSPGDLFIRFLTESDIIANANSLITILPICIQSKFNLILNEITKFEQIDEKLRIIVSNNLIVTFLLIFKQRYFEIQSNKFCLQLKITEGMIQNQIDKSYGELMYFNENMNHEINNEIKSLLNKEREIIDKINVTSLVEKSKQFECMLIDENKPSKPFQFTDIKKIEFDECFNEKSIFEKTCDTIDFSFPSIDVVPDHSLSSYIEFFSSCSISSILLPVFIFHHLIKKKSIDLFERYFAILYNLYKEITKESPENRSVLSYSINQFIESFEICLNKLTLAGVNFDKNVSQDDLDKCKYIYIKLVSVPKIVLPSLPQISWK